MSGPGSRGSGGILTPAVIAAAVFVVLSGGVAITFVAARGGLVLPVAPMSPGAVAVASPLPSFAGPSLAPTGPTPSRTPGAGQGTPAATLDASPEPAASPSASSAPSAPAVGPSPLPTATPAPTGPPDPLAALPPCPDHPGCYEYTVRPGDSYTAINDRFGLLLWITDALNPEVVDTRLITVGQTLYLGRDPEARLDPCPDGAACRLYTTRSGDTLSRIAGRFGITVTGIEALNPSLDPNAFGPGTLVRLPLYQG